MQILTEDFLEGVGCPVINIHHSFLPAFAGAGPYERARQRGVKLIGATAHYVTKDRSEEHTSELQSLRRISYAVFCLKKKNTTYYLFTYTLVTILIYLNY